MARADNRYSRFVSWAKIILPLAALALLSSLVLFSRRIDPEASIPYAKVDVAELARKQAVGRPTYSTMTRDGAAISVTATSALPDLTNPARATAQELNARIDTPDGVTIDITAREGRIDSDHAQVDLQQDVEIATSTGYVIRSQAMTTATDRTEVTSPGPITAEGPFGTLDAGSMTLTSAPGAGDGTQGGLLLVFQKGVKLVYGPEK
ncbi:LPS export ABC transporter periplasmic protein LptC [Brevirhabdus sp.]|uniref:LPS export ABC transporter periplasmic protein LptC n=1 Tax=Brevirhabdus sp. TaxID=2004514 RepID=UPI0040588CD7